MRNSLTNFALQEKLVDAVKEGTDCVYAAKILSLINLRHWNFELTKNLCENMDLFMKKTNQLLRCKEPLLFLVLVAEMLNKIRPQTLIYAGICQKTMQNILKFALEIESNIKEEEILYEYLMHTDIEDRSALLVISFNSFYDLLSHEDIASIVSKLWTGSRKSFSIVDASTIYRSTQATSIEETLCFTKSIDKTKPYLFQFDQWTDSCSLRFLGQAVSTVLLVFFYTMAVHNATLSGNMNDVASDPTALAYLRLSQL